MKKLTMTMVLWIAATLLTSLSVFGQSDKIAAGKVFRFINAGKNTALTAQAPYENIVVSATNPDLMSQCWYAESPSTGKYTLRSLNNGKYLATSAATSTPWKWDSEPGNNSTLTITRLGSNYVIRGARDSNSYGYAHADASNVIVCWENSNTNSQWILQEVEMSDEELQAALDKVSVFADVEKSAAAWQAALDKVFADKSCTTLRPDYASKSKEQLLADETVKSLPEELRNMVVKVATDNWEETNSTDSSVKWDSKHAKKYRVQLYEPYSDPTLGANLAAIQAWSYINNPTGINANSGDVLYVMVENAPKDGSHLTLAGLTGIYHTKSSNPGIELKEGLNVIPSFANMAAQHIFYTVDVTDNSGKRKRKISEFDPIKIHIEGGDVNGFFNYLGDALYTPDTNEDWAYCRTRAKHDAFDLVGNRVILHFSMIPQYDNNEGTGSLQRGLYEILNPATVSFDLPAILTAWDNFITQERAVMGLLSPEELKGPMFKDLYQPIEDDDIVAASFYDYLNTKTVGITAPGSPYMHATWGETAYKPSTMPDILLNLPNSSGAIWGPAHEYGHTNQGPMKLVGTTEISNNIFSNVAVWHQGLATSRADFPSSQARVFNNGQTYLENGTWGCTRMFFQLWCYYHVAGKNPKFYPRLYELLRRTPIQKPYYMSARYDQLHFAKMACIAAQEDLTDFFESWGFFVPLDNYHVDDYSENFLSLTPEDAQAVRDEIAAYKFPKNPALIFIDDRIGSDRASYSNEWKKELCGDLGGIKDFVNGTASDGKYSYVIEGNTVKVSGGTGGVGFIVYDNNNKLIGFSNYFTFDLSTEAIMQILRGTAKIYSVDSDSKLKEVKTAWDNDPEVRIQLCNTMIDRANGIISKANAEDVVVGYYRPDAVLNLPELIEALQTLLADKSTSASDLYIAYTNLSSEVFNVEEDPYSKIEIVCGNTYRIDNVGFPRNTLMGSKNELRKGSSTSKLDAVKWQFEKAPGENSYYIRNLTYGYIQSATEKSGKFPMGEEKVPFTITLKSFGVYAIQANGENDFSLNVNANNNAILAWTPNEEASQWTIHLVDTDEMSNSISELNTNINRTEALMAKAGNVGNKYTPVTLTNEMISTNAKNTVTTYGEQFVSWNVILDGDGSTFFHSDYSGKNSSDKLDHHITVDLGEGNEMDVFSISYTTRSGTNSRAPKDVTVYVSNDNNEWSVASKLNSGLPMGGGLDYVSDAIICDKPYRYIRFMVHSTYDGMSAGGHEFFCLAEFGISKVSFVCDPFPSYPEVTRDLLMECYESVVDGKSLLHSDEQKAEVYTKASDRIYTNYVALNNAMKTHSGISNIGDDRTDFDINGADNVIYDLAGRRLSAISRPGIYIVNGKKVAVKATDLK